MKSLPIRTLALAAVVLMALSALSACASTRSPGEQIEDQEIKTKVNAKFTGDSNVNPFRIDTDVREGVVYLRGEVTNAQAKARAEELARDTHGVTRVVNQVQVVSRAEQDDERLSDAWILTKVKAKLAADPEINPFNIDVDVDDGVVTLSGRVAKASTKIDAERLAGETKGVNRVVNELAVGDKEKEVVGDPQ